MGGEVSELRPEDLTRCAACGEGLATQVPVFYRVTLEQHVVDLAAVQRLGGLVALMGGNQQLAAAFSPDSHYTRRMFSNSMLLCQECAMEASVMQAFPAE